MPNPIAEPGLDSCCSLCGDDRMAESWVCKKCHWKLNGESRKSVAIKPVSKPTVRLPARPAKKARTA